MKRTCSVNTCKLHPVNATGRCTYHGGRAHGESKWRIYLGEHSLVRTETGEETELYCVSCSTGYKFSSAEESRWVHGYFLETRCL